MVTIELSRIQAEYGFEATDAKGYKVRMDTNTEMGGQNFGASPMQLLLMGLGGCSAIDVINILKKQKQTVTDYRMVITGEREPNKEPSLWKKVLVEFHIYGSVDIEKAEHAVELSINKYCSVAATLKAGGTNIEWKIFVNEEMKTQKLKT